jgi:outer membrane protein assembly factor BamB
MIGSVSWLLLLLVLGCDDPEPPRQPTFEPPPAPTPPPAEPPDVPTAERPFRWYVEASDRDTASFGDGALHDHTAQHIVGDERRYVARRVDGDVEVVRENRQENEPAVEPAWTKRFELEATGEPVIGSTMGSPLYVAVPAEAGYGIAAIDAESGDVLWQRAHVLAADGEVGLQLDFGDGEITVYIRGAHDALHVLDAEDGSLVSRARFGTEIRAPGPNAPPEAIAGTARGGRGGPDEAYRVRRHGDGLALERTGSTSWRTPLVPAQVFDDHLVIVEAGGRLVAISYCANASGAYAFGFDPATGAIAWTSSVGSIGNIGHSRYSNDVSALARGDRLVVYGNESGGSYVGVVDAREGRLVGWEVWRR